MKDVKMPWLIGAVIFLLTAGFAKLSIVIVNRTFARPQPKWAVAGAEVIQILLIPIYGWLLAQRLGRTGPRLFFTDRDWSEIARFEGSLLILGVIGFGMLVHATLTYQLYRPPLCEIESQSERVDLRQIGDPDSWRERLVGLRPMRSIALLPGNQQFTIEVSTKTYELPRLPMSWDGLSIVQFADTHFRGAVTRACFEAICDQAIALKPDLFVFTGDLLDDLSLLDWIPSTLGRLKAPLGQYFILGNHDWYLDPSTIRKEIERHGWIDLAGRCLELQSPASRVPIVLAGDETPWMGTHPYLGRGSADLFRILISHTPDNITWARDQHIDLMLAGHTHGGQIRLPLLGPVYSPSRFGCRYASGVFWLDPTLLYVSRGISGREPIRYNCAPELTKLVLRTRASSERASQRR
jgi:predicted MPP superfamily phosphohydrolase